MVASSPPAARWRWIACRLSDPPLIAVADGARDCMSAVGACSCDRGPAGEPTASAPEPGAVTRTRSRPDASAGRGPRQRPKPRRDERPHLVDVDERGQGLPAARGRKATNRARGRGQSVAGPAATLGLVGESGSGKTTLARVVAGLTPPTAGRRSPRGRGAAGATVGQRRQRRPPPSADGVPEPGGFAQPPAHRGPGTRAPPGALSAGLDREAAARAGLRAAGRRALSARRTSTATRRN